MMLSTRDLGLEALGTDKVRCNGKTGLLMKETGS
jgi:hypothetical protein